MKNKKILAIVAMVLVLAITVSLAGCDMFDSNKQAAKKAYQQYVIDHSAEGKMPAYIVYTAEGGFVAIQDGAAVGVYETQEEAVKAMLGEGADCDVVDLSEGKLFACVVKGENTISMQYDDYLTHIGDIAATDMDASFTDACLEVVTVNDTTYFHAKATGFTKITAGEASYEVVVSKAKINLIVAMGQSNAGSHFENATTDIRSPLGTAYRWGDGRHGGNATTVNKDGAMVSEPVYYDGTDLLNCRSWHMPMMAELYAQSVAAGDPVKNVLIFQEGATTKNGQAIETWAVDSNDTSGTTTTVTMINNCRHYFEQHSDLYEIVSSGVYWIQGEGDWQLAPDVYQERFLAIWDRLKEEADMEYVAFFRVRHGGVQNNAGTDPNHEDLNYHNAVLAQLDMINAYEEFYLATTLTENWTGTEDTTHTIDISKYITIMETYSTSDTHTDSYDNNATYADGKLTTTMKELFGSNAMCHYGKFGYTLMGADAAYNMYHALHTDSFAIVQADSSGKPEVQTVSQPGDEVTLDITEMTRDLTFRAACGSTAGVIDILVESEGFDITFDVVGFNNDNYGLVDMDELKKSPDATITVTDKPVNGEEGSVVYTIVNNG